MDLNCFVKKSAFVCLLFMQYTCFAQGLHFPDDNQIDIGTDRIDFCKPGVTNKSPGKGILIEHTSIGGFNIRLKSSDGTKQNTNNVNYASRMKAKLKIPLVNAPGLKMMLGHEYIGETFQFNTIQPEEISLLNTINGQTLKNNKFSLYITKSFNQKYYGGLRARVSSRGNYEQVVSLEATYTTFSATGFFGIKERPDFEWGFGLTYSDNFARKQIWPFFLYNRTFNDRWGIEAILPASIMARYNFSNQNMFLFGVELENAAYHITPSDVDQTSYYFRHTEVAAKASYDRHLFSWIWVLAEAGAHIPVRNRFEDSRAPLTDRTRYDAGVRPFVRLGIFVSPPKSLVK